MDKKIAGLLGAVSAIATVSGADAATTPSASPSSYADLLRPIPNAVVILAEADAQSTPSQNENIQVADVVVIKHHHHHHRHHHHHHHHD